VINALSGSYGCFWGAAAGVDPKDLAGVLPNSSQLGLMMSAAVYGEDTHVAQGANGISIKELDRGGVIADMVSQELTPDLTLADWPQKDRDAFKIDARTAVRALLSRPHARIWHWTQEQDWTDDAWISVDADSGEVRVVAQGGDC
jgi:hypothetical protein